MNPYSNEKVPLWIGDFVLGTYGTGCVFGDAHDERDLIFAKKYGIPLKLSVRPDRDAGYMVIEKSLPSECVDRLKDFGGVAVERTDDEWGRFFRVTVPTAREPEFIRFLENNLLSKGSNATDGGWYADSIGTTNVLVFPGRHLQAWDDTALETFKEHGIGIGITPSQLDIDLFKISFTDDGILVGSGEYDGLASAEARRVLTERAEREGFGKKKVNYKLRDWIFSRQRYWGEPIPLIHLKKEDIDNLPTLVLSYPSSIWKENILPLGSESSYNDASMASKLTEGMAIVIINKHTDKQVLGRVIKVCNAKQDPTGLNDFFSISTISTIR